MNDTIEEQRALCAKYGAPWVEAPSDLKVGIARNVIGMTTLPLNGLRHPPEGDTTGWYFWAGETLSTDPDFFEPMHVAHLAERCPALLRFLGLAPGWRFLLAEDYVDVWHDPKLLDV
jgi:hypothetical protein